jgi:putative ABC transport system substrate-binding protein
MKRRELITLLGGAAAMWPLGSRAQQSGGIKRIGILMAYAETDSQAQGYFNAFRDEFQRLGWVEGRNIRIDTRWAALDPDAMQRFAKELIALQPDLILSQITPTTAALLQETRTIPIIFGMLLIRLAAVSSRLSRDRAATSLALSQARVRWEANG